MAGFGGFFSLFAPVSHGFAAAATDGGIPSGDPSDWALLSPGNVDHNTLHTFGSTALADMTVIGQQLTRFYYGKPPKYKYWNGCSTGGRQGIQMAQSHPELYDGILATAPAVHMPSLGTAMHWPQIVMQSIKSWPQPCELQALTAAAITACDELDGVTDGIVSAPAKCRKIFDPFTLVNRTVPCPLHPPSLITISLTAAKVASAAWSGPFTSQEENLFPPLNHEANLSAVTATYCETLHPESNFAIASPSCQGLPNVLSSQWIQLFLLRKPFPPSTTRFQGVGLTSPHGDPYRDLVKITREEYDELFAMANREYNSAVASDNPDLSAFAKRGGKMITWHGMADELIPPGGSVDYYESVADHLRKYPRRYQKATSDLGSIDTVTDFYRLYLAPGVGHCMNGVGPYPGMAWDSAGALDQLMAWVENGTKPDVLHAVSNGDSEGKRIRRPLCVWPKVAKFTGKKGKEREAEGWICKKGD